MAMISIAMRCAICSILFPFGCTAGESRDERFGGHCVRSSVDDESGLNFGIVVHLWSFGEDAGCDLPSMSCYSARLEGGDLGRRLGIGMRLGRWGRDRCHLGFGMRSWRLDVGSLPCVCGVGGDWISL